ncbi:MAG: sensor histidine kinase [Boseongicola sp.]|nr:MAG: sensor histidine kinase [Boseongicola sp.]
MRWTFHYLPIKIRAPLAAALLLILVGAIASQHVLSRLSKTQDQNLQSVATVFLTGLSATLEPSVLNEDIWTTFAILEQFKGDGAAIPVNNLVVVDASGIVLAAGDPEKYSNGSALPDTIQSAGDVNKVSLVLTGESLWVRRDINYQGQPIGSVYAEFDVTRYLSERSSAIWSLFIGNALATLLLSIAGFFLIRRMLRYVSTISDYMKGDNGHPEPIPEALFPSDRNEFRELFARYNQLVSAEEQRRQAMTRLSEQARLVSLGRLSSTLAHEINNPLGGLLNAVDTAKRYQDSPEALGKSLELIERGLRTIADVARGTLDFYRTDRRAVALSTSDFEDIALLLEPELRKKSQKLVRHIGATDPVLADFSNGLVRQIVLNLLLNASAATPENGTLHLNVTEDPSGCLIIRIADEGPGLPADSRDILLSETPLNPGAGLGLRLVRDLVGELQGEIDILTHENGGTEIVIRLQPDSEHGYAA